MFYQDNYIALSGTTPNTGWPTSYFPDVLYYLTVIIFTCIQLIFSTWLHWTWWTTILRISVASYCCFCWLLVLNKVVFLWNVSIILVKWLLGILYIHFQCVIFLSSHENWTHSCVLWMHKFFWHSSGRTEENYKTSNRIEIFFHVELLCP